jgi:serine/threonine protein kinase
MHENGIIHTDIKPDNIAIKNIDENKFMECFFDRWLNKKNLHDFRYPISM